MGHGAESECPDGKTIGTEIETATKEFGSTLPENPDDDDRDDDRDRDRDRDREEGEEGRDRLRDALRGRSSRGRGRN